MHDHTKQQLELFNKKFPYYPLQSIDADDCVFKSEIEYFIQQALKSQAEMIRAEMDSAIGSLNGLGGCECCISKVNKQKASLDELINSFK